MFYLAPNQINSTIIETVSFLNAKEESGDGVENELGFHDHD